MPDGIQPVGAMIQPPNPQQAVGTLSGIIGLKQQQQALQTGQYQQQAAQAEAQQAQQKNTELQKVGALMKSVHDGGYRDKAGNFDNVKFANDVSMVAPTYGQAIASTAVSRGNEIVANQRAKQGLTEESRGELGNVLTSLATNPQTRRGDVVDAMTRYITDHKDDPNAIRVATAQLALLPPDDGTPNFRNVLSNYAGSLTGKPQAAPSTVDTGTVIQPGQTSAVTGAFTPAGGAIPKQSLVTTPAGPLAVATPARGTLAPLGQAAPGNLNTTRALQENVQGMAQDDRARYAQISQEGTNAQGGAQLADQVAKLADEVRTGKLSKEWTDRLTVLQQHDPSLTARQMLSKYAAQLKTMATAGATTDASRSQIDEGMPSPETMGPDAVKEAAQYVGGIFRMRGARQDYADRYARNAGSSIGLRDADDTFMRAADPSVFAYSALSPGKERQEFLQKHFGGDTAKLHQFGARLNQVKHYAGSE